MSNIELYHYTLSRDVYKGRLASGFYRNNWPENLWLKKVDNPDFDFFKEQVMKMDRELFWYLQDKLKDPDVFTQERLKGPESAMYMLMDGDREVGFTLVKSMPRPLKEKFFSAANDTVDETTAIEIDYLGLFEGEPGYGRGKAYFEMMFDKLFKFYKNVYWSQHSTNAPTLKRYYIQKLGMSLRETEEKEDFRPPEVQEAGIGELRLALGGG